MRGFYTHISIQAQSVRKSLCRLLVFLTSVLLVVTLIRIPLVVFASHDIKTAYGASGKIISVDGNKTAAQLVSKLIGPGIRVENIAAVGLDKQRGIFTDGEDTFGLSTGIILSTGNAKYVEPASLDKPNSVYNQSDWSQDRSDADLKALAGGASIYDATTITFDFYTEENYMTFSYVFASEEYHEYSLQQYKDVFAFIINGVNYAVVPGTSTPISVGSINHLTNTSYFINNNPHKNVNDASQPTIKESDVAMTEMDGFTTVLHIQAPVKKTEKNTMKLAIGDVAAQDFDSNVLIGTMSSQPPAVSLAEPTNLTVSETTAKVSFTVQRDTALKASTIDFKVVEGSAKSGQDYLDASGKVSFTIGESAKTVAIPLINRSGSYQGDRSFTVKLQNGDQCRIVAPSEGTVVILDTDPEPVYYTVTETFLDTSGNPVDSVVLVNRQTEVEYHFTATNFPQNHTPSGGATYIYLGYKLGTYSAGDLLTAGTPVAISVVAPLTISYIYQPVRPLTISKIVTGDYADYKRSFSFTLSFQDSNKEKLPAGTRLSYTGGVVLGSGAAAPAHGALVLENGGTCVISLQHGQSITLSEVALGYRVRIVEEDIPWYTATYLDSVTATTKTSVDTDFLDMTNADRTIAFTNALIEAPPTGIAGDNVNIPILILVAASMLAVVATARRLMRYRKMYTLQKEENINA